jgi:hypothetical protein
MKISALSKPFYALNDVFDLNELELTTEIFDKIKIFNLYKKASHEGRLKLNSDNVTWDSPIYFEHQTFMRLKVWGQLGNFLQLEISKHPDLKHIKDLYPSLSMHNYGHDSRYSSFVKKVRKRVEPYLPTKLANVFVGRSGGGWVFEMSYNSATSGYRVDNHLDQRHKVLAGVVYLSEPPPDKITEGSFLINGEDGQMIMEQAQRQNTGVVFFNTNASWHSTRDFSDWGYTRDFIYFSLSFPEVNSIF